MALSPHIKRFEPQDHPKIAEWWTAHGWTPVALHLLPKTGLVVDGVAAGWLYLTDSPIAWMEWIVTNPAAPGKARHEALVALVDALVAEAEAHGATCVFTSTNDDKLAARYTAHGFLTADKQVTQMWKIGNR